MKNSFYDWSSSPQIRVQRKGEPNKNSDPEGGLAHAVRRNIVSEYRKSGVCLDKGTRVSNSMSIVDSDKLNDALRLLNKESDS